MVRSGTTRLYRISAPSMIYGFDLEKNIRRLAGHLDHIEIVLFQTPDRHNIPEEKEMNRLETIQHQTGVTYSVHLPSAYEIASEDKSVREVSPNRVIRLVRYFQRLTPTGFILHIPMTPPTLVPEPGCYIHHTALPEYREWSGRAFEGLTIIQNETGLERQLLIENINYSPRFLEPFMQKKLGALCLDIGHLLLGGEPVRPQLERYAEVIDEIHLHGVKGWEEHLALEVLPRRRVRKWVGRLEANGFNGVLNLEVFSPADLFSSLDMLN